MYVAVRAPLVGFIAALLLPLSVFATGAESGSSPTPLVTTEATDTAGFASVSVRAFAEDTGEELKGGYAGAEVYFYRAYMGRTPYVDTAVPPGTYVVGVRASGYYPAEILIVFAEKTRYVLTFTLTRRTGFLAIHAEPADADIFIDGRPQRQGSIELATGLHRIRIRRFGYVERVYAVDIPDRGTVFLDARLDLAPFELSDLRVSKPAFNPRNAGPLGETVLSFEVTSYGHGAIELYSQKGERLARQDFPSFETWNHSFSWNGRDGSGAPLPDGVYRARLEAFAAGAEGGTALVREQAIRIDSSLIVEPFGMAAASPGLAYFPDPQPVPRGTLSLDLSAYATSLDVPPALAVHFGASLGRLGIGLSSAVETSETAESSGSLAASLFWRLAEEWRPISLALFMRGGYAPSSPRAPVAAAADCASLEAALPLAIRAGCASLGIAPGVACEFAHEEAALRSFIRAGAWLSGPRFRTGLSAECAWGGLTRGIFDLAWPARIALEGRYIIGASPFVLSGGIYGALAPAMAPRITVGLGLGFIM